MVICYHDNDDLHGEVHVRSFLLQDSQRKDGQMKVIDCGETVYEVASKNAATKREIFQLKLN